MQKFRKHHLTIVDPRGPQSGTKHMILIIVALALDSTVDPKPKLTVFNHVIQVKLFVR